MTESVESKLKELEEFEDKIYDLGKRMHPGYTYSLDVLANAVMDRSLHLIFAFTNLIRNENYIAACHLVRCHLDNVLRISGAWLVNDPHQFASDIMNGKKVDEIKDRNGNNLKDWYLRNKLSEEFPWVQSVYKETSGFIHLSKKHIFTSSKIKDNEKNTIEFRISRKDNYVTDESRINATNGMIEITKVLIHFIEGWIWTKNNTDPLVK
ncbi:hypothetical protein [Aestuariibaculum suncheonense]|uniref:Uncharacterized protein n=1 Tax=Aestuariibaculum suncheonense TaxID=1028745 RepID=A0A8J6QIL2_9FLAO|nr:hypothetical protein [Aestuariibaculum suncheonense]MBD0836960.1 hypothetical protein [Aestuariibaculum suncheonense]